MNVVSDGQLDRVHVPPIPWSIRPPRRGDCGVAQCEQACTTKSGLIKDNLILIPIGIGEARIGVCSIHIDEPLARFVP